MWINIDHGYIESQVLEQRQEAFREQLDLASQLCHLLRVCYLYTGDSWNCGAIWSEQGSRDIGFDGFCRWLWCRFVLQFGLVFVKRQKTRLKPDIDAGPMIWSPLSELPMVGRSPTYVYTLIVFVFFQFGVIYAKNFGMLLAFRFLTGFIGSPALATGGASMGDLWSPRVSDYMIAIWGAFSIAAPILGPLVGGFASTAKGWRWPIWELLWVSGFTLVLLFFFLPETYAPNILARRARRLRRITEDPNHRSQAEIELENVTAKVN